MRLAYSHAVVSQLVESHLAKVEVTGSSPAYRSRDDHVSSRLSPRQGRDCSTQSRDRFMAWIASMAAGSSRLSAANAGMAELVYAQH